MKTILQCKTHSWIQSNQLLALPAALLLLGATATQILGAPGDVDESFNPGSSFSHPITAIQLQPDGKALVVGRFTAAPGAYRGRVARLNLDGSTDESFLGGLPGANGDVLCATLQPDGKLVIGGSFTAVNGVTRNRIARLNGDGTVDESFQNGLAGVTGEVESMARQSNGQILVGGTFSGNGLTSLARLNADGSLDTSFIGKTGGGNPGDGRAVIAIAVQSDGKIVIAGWFTSVNDANRSYLARLTASGVLDNTFTPTFTAPGNSIELGSLFLQSDDKLIIGGLFNGVNGVARNNLARLNANGTTDASFLAGLSGPDNRVYAIAQLSDGKILIGGYFTTVNGVARAHLARLNSNGSLDTLFASATTLDNVLALAVQADGRVLASSSLDYQDPTYLCRFNADGSADTTYCTVPRGPDTAVAAVARQSDGKVVIGGWFHRVNGLGPSYLARLNPDGSRDGGFLNGMAGFNNPVEGILCQPNGQVLVRGRFTSVNGTARADLARLQADGALDASFTPTLLTIYTPALSSFVLQPDGRILLAGNFTSVNGVSRNRVARLNPDGTLDNSFLNGVSGFNNQVNCLALQPDGKILAGGYFTSVNGAPRTSLARLRVDGTLDETFQASVGELTCLALQPDGKILAAGYFSSVGGLSRTNLARLNADGSADPSFGNVPPGIDPFYFTSTAVVVQPDGRILYGRKVHIAYGGAPMLMRLNADGSTDSSFDVRFTGGYGEGVEIMAIVLEADGHILAAGTFATVNQFARRQVVRLIGDSQSSGYVSLPGNQPFDRTNALGTVATFTVAANGAPPLFYQWRKAGAALSDGGNISGAQTASLTLSNLSGLDAGGYSVLVTNLYGSATSRVATLTVADPFIVTQPASLSRNAGQTAQFTVNAAGTPPLSYQWLKDASLLMDGLNISGAQTATLTLGNVLSSDAGAYSVVVTNTFGSVTSFVATLTIAPPPGDNLLQNGDFESGNVGFTNGYSYSPGSLGPEGYYDVVTNPRLDHPLAASFGDHTTGSGLMLALNGSPNANTVVWGQTVNVVPGSTYSFAGWAATWGTSGPGPDPSPPMLRFVINGQPQGADVALNSPVGQWQHFIVTWHSESSTVAIIRIFDMNLAGVGNDFALDDLQFTAVGPSPPAILTGPESQTAPAGGSASFSVQAGGTAPLGYQWLKDGANLSDGGNVSGAQTPMLTLTNLFSGDAGGYAVVITNAYGSVTSLVATLTVADPFIVTQPTSLSRNAGQTAQFTVTAAGTPPLDYQWRKDGVSLSDDGNVSGAHTATLILSSVLGADRGGYSVVVSNPSGSVTSLVATLTVADPFIITQPASQTASTGQTVQFSVVAGGTAPFSYQWLKNGLGLSDGGNISGARTATLTLSSVSGGTAGSYAVVVSNGYSSVTSSVGVLALLTQPGLVVNGSFESPVVSGYDIFTTIPGWTTTFGRGIEIQHNGAGTAFDGQQLVELDSDSNSGMAQQIPTMPGQVYQLGFAYSPRPFYPRESNGIDVFFNNTLLAGC